MATYFISDLHLSPANPQVFAGLMGFLQTTAKGAEALYILGDFFDAWLGDDDDSEAALTVLNALKNYSASGTPLYFLQGNRDFLVGERFAQACNCTLLDELTTIDLYGRRTLLMHGDTLCTEDTDYLQFRAMVRNPAWQQQVLSLPLPERRKIAAELRAKSQSLNAMKASEIMDVTPNEVINTMATAEVDLLIHGHTHRPARHELIVNDAPAERIVLGDWHDNGWYLKAEANGELDLVKFPLA